MRYRVNRPLIKQQAKAIFFRHWQALLLAGILIVALNTALDLMRSWFLPQLQLNIPAEALTDPETMELWLQNWSRGFIDSLDANFWLIFGLLGVLTLLVTVPLQFGLYQLCWQATFSEEPLKASAVFRWITDLRRVGGSIGVTFCVAVLSLLWILLFHLPFLALILFVLLGPPLPVGSLLSLVSVLYLLLLAGVFFSMFRICGYMAVRYAYASRPQEGIRAAFRDTGRLLKGRRWEFFVLYLSFLLWNIASNLTYGVLNLFVTPYFCITVILFLNAVRQGPTAGPSVNPWSPEDSNGPQDGQY